MPTDFPGTPASPRAIGLPSGTTLARQVLQHLKAQARERRSLAQLRRLDDRLLRDVGLTRADVIAMVEARRR